MGGRKDADGSSLLGCPLFAGPVTWERSPVSASPPWVRLRALALEGTAVTSAPDVVEHECEGSSLSRKGDLMPQVPQFGRTREDSDSSLVAR